MLYFLTDHLGSVMAVTDASGTLLDEQRYMPFGQVRTDVGEIDQTDFGYTFQRNLPDMGLMDYRARMYDARIGRFIQPDSIVPLPQYPLAWNRFAYVLNQPINLSDPSGYTYCDGDLERCSTLQYSIETTQTSPVPAPTIEEIFGFGNSSTLSSQASSYIGWGGELPNFQGEPDLSPAVFSSNPIFVIISVIDLYVQMKAVEVAAYNLDNLPTDDNLFTNFSYSPISVTISPEEISTTSTIYSMTVNNYSQQDVCLVNMSGTLYNESQQAAIYNYAYTFPNEWPCGTGSYIPPNNTEPFKYYFTPPETITISWLEVYYTIYDNTLHYNFHTIQTLFFPP